MSLYFTTQSAVRIIAALTRDDIPLAVKAWDIWREYTHIDPSQCVDLAREVLRVEATNKPNIDAVPPQEQPTQC